MRYLQKCLICLICDKMDPTEVGRLASEITLRKPLNSPIP